MLVMVVHVNELRDNELYCTFKKGSDDEFYIIYILS